MQQSIVAPQFRKIDLAIVCIMVILPFRARLFGRGNENAFGLKAGFCDRPESMVLGRTLVSPLHRFLPLGAGVTGLAFDPGLDRVLV